MPELYLTGRRPILAPSIEKACEVPEGMRNRYLVDFLAVLADIVKYRSHKQQDDTDEQRPVGNHIAGMVDAHWFCINRIYF